MREYSNTHSTSHQSAVIRSVVDWKTPVYTLERVSLEKTENVLVQNNFDLTDTLKGSWGPLPRVIGVAVIKCQTAVMDKEF